MSLQNSIYAAILNTKVYEIALKTPLHFATMLSETWRNQIFLKREDLQPIHSFKIRGAYQAISSIAPEDLPKGVICASAGNHAQGVACSAKKRGIPAWVVMPKTTPDIKVAAVTRMGAQVILAGDHYSEAFEHCLSLIGETGASMIHPFDDIRVIAGQGTVGKEILDECHDLDAIFVPVGGGGLLAGIAAYVKKANPRIRVYGVEPSDSDAMVQSSEQAHRVVLDHVGTFADGVAVKQVGKLTFDLCQSLVDGYYRVKTDEICSAIQDIYGETRVIVEPAGALSLAGAKKYILETGIRGEKLATINSGANMSFQRLQFVAERAMTGNGRESLFAVTLANRPGALKAFCNQILTHRNITEFNFRSHGTVAAHIFLGLTIKNHQDHENLTQQFKQLQYPYFDLTENELAKEHMRHMVGGRMPEHKPEHKPEQLYSFVFPERPCALSDFLSGVSTRWNISLFHYRSHGGDYGRVLIGFEMEQAEVEEFEQHLVRVGYPFQQETSNRAYQLFCLGSVQK